MVTVSNVEAIKLIPAYGTSNAEVIKLIPIYAISNVGKKSGRVTGYLLSTGMTYCDATSSRDNTNTQLLFNHVDPKF